MSEPIIEETNQPEKQPVEEKEKQLVEEKEKQPVENCLKIKISLEQILLGILMISCILILFVTSNPIILIHILISVCILVIISLYIINKNLTIKLLETGLFLYPCFFL